MSNAEKEYYETIIKLLKEITEELRDFNSKGGKS